MIFCPKCSSLLKIKREKNKKYFSCSCGYTNRDIGDVKLKEEVKREEKDVTVVNEDEETLPLTEAECSRCGHDKAYYWLVQTRAGDEADTKFFKCEKCKYTWREN
jgi:DNA-directed RNA polymerase subunit M